MMIRANSREKFTSKDFDFIVSTLSKKKEDRAYIQALLEDSESRDALFDHTQVFRALVQKNGQKGRTLSISLHFYFYVLCRKALKDFGIDDKNIADYISSLLSEFCNTRNVHSVSYHDDRVYHYIVDLLLDLLEASSWEAFLLRSHIGNYSLFLTGIFPDYIYNKSLYGRCSPGFEYYERIGSLNYHLASTHRIATKYGLSSIFEQIANQFHQVRLALNCLTDKFINLDDRTPSLNKILRSVFHGPKRG